jgi:CheY-like chemotaxis protein
MDPDVMDLSYDFLCISDDQIRVDELSRVLHGRGIKYEVVRDGENAVKRWTDGGIDLILVSLPMQPKKLFDTLFSPKIALQLPIMDGFAVTREIRRLEQSPDALSVRSTQGGNNAAVIIVAMTASSDRSERVNALAAGCNDFLITPLDIAWLEQKIDEWGSMKALEKWVTGSDHRSQSIPSANIDAIETLLSTSSVPSVETHPARRNTFANPRVNEGMNFRIEGLPRPGSHADAVYHSGIIPEWAGHPSTSVRSDDSVGLGQLPILDNESSPQLTPSLQLPLTTSRSPTKPPSSLISIDTRRVLAGDPSSFRSLPEEPLGLGPNSPSGAVIFDPDRRPIGITFRPRSSASAHQSSSPRKTIETSPVSTDGVDY